MNTSGEFRPEPVDEIADGTESVDTFGMKEVLSMIQDELGDLKASEEQVNKILDELFMEPIPPLDDEGAKRDYYERMQSLLKVARAQNARADLILSLERRFAEKLEKLQESS